MVPHDLVGNIIESESESAYVVETNPRKYPDGDQPFNGPIFLRERARDLGILKKMQYSIKKSLMQMFEKNISTCV